MIKFSKFAEIKLAQPKRGHSRKAAKVAYHPRDNLIAIELGGGSWHFAAPIPSKQIDTVGPAWNNQAWRQKRYMECLVVANAATVQDLDRLIALNDAEDAAAGLANQARLLLSAAEKLQMPLNQKQLRQINRHLPLRG